LIIKFFLIIVTKSFKMHSLGVTPYASILKDIWHHLGSTEPDEFNLKLKKVYFYWIFSAIDSFEW
jgi:hypothetical protein